MKTLFYIATLTTLCIPTAALAQDHIYNVESINSGINSTANNAMMPVTIKDTGGHRGFLFRSELGGGYHRYSIPVQHVVLDGPGYNVNLTFGGFVAKNIAIVGEFNFAGLDSPNVYSYGEYLGKDSSTLTYAAVGPGVIFYLPADYSIGLCGQYSNFHVATEQLNAWANGGAGFSGRFSKEWFPTRHLGLGLGAQLQLGTIDNLSNQSVNFTAINLLFSLTVN